MPPRDEHHDWVHSVLGLDPGPGKKGGGGAAGVARRFKKAGEVWRATRVRVDSEIDKLCKTIMAADHGGEFGDALEKEFLSTVDPILSTLDESLAHMMEQVSQAKDADATTALKAEARKTVGRYMKFVAGNAVITELDRNPFVKVSIGKTLESSLTALNSMLR